MKRSAKITHILAREILDSRGRPTLEVDVFLESGAWGRGVAPSGASTGSREALELRDGDPSRFQGLGVRLAVTNVRRRIGPALRGRNALEQVSLDELLCEIDGTENKSRLGANAIVAASMACCRAAAAALTVEPWEYVARLAGTKPVLPLPMVNILSGGRHAGGPLEFQDFLIIPLGAETYGQALEMASNVYAAVRKILEPSGFHRLVADEGGFGPALESNERALELLAEAVRSAGYSPDQVAVGLDVASTQFYREGRYELRGPRALDREAMIDFLEELCERYPIVSLEDGLHEDDWEGWRDLTARLGKRVQLLGDDFFVTSPHRIARGVQKGCANAVLLKLNQVGTVTETLEALRRSREAGYNTVVSARSGETEDDFLADFAVGAAAGQIKIGSLTRSERLAKYNRLLRIDERLGSGAYTGSRPLQRFREPSIGTARPPASRREKG